MQPPSCKPRLMCGMPVSRSTSFNMRTFPTTAILMSVSALCCCHHHGILTTALSCVPVHAMIPDFRTLGTTSKSTAAFVTSSIQLILPTSDIFPQPHLNPQPSSSSISSPLDPATYSLVKGKSSITCMWLHCHLLYTLPSNS